MSETEWFCGVQLGGVKLPAEFLAARNSKSMVHAGTGRWRQKNGRPMLIVGSRLAVYRTSKEPVCPRVELILKIIIILLIIFLGFIKSKPC